MSKNESTTVVKGSGITGLLGVAFVVLKLTGIIDWSWWWVTLPFWSGLVFVLAIILIAIIIVVIKDEMKRFKAFRKRKARK